MAGFIIVGIMEKFYCTSSHVFEEILGIDVCFGRFGTAVLAQI